MTLNSRTVAISLILVSAGALAFAFVMDRVYDVLPCQLCIYQRQVYGAVLVLGVVAYFANRFPHWVGWLCFASAIAFVVGAGIAIHHVGVEYDWWGSSSNCNGELTGQLSLHNLRERLQNVTSVSCNEVMWRFQGLSLAGWNAVASIALTVLAIWAGIRLRRA